jgi:GTP-binding protein HflX
LGTAILDRIEAGMVAVDLLIPYDRGDALAAAHRAGEVVHQEHMETGTAVGLRLPQAAIYEFAEFVVG